MPLLQLVEANAEVGEIAAHVLQQRMEGIEEEIARRLNSLLKQFTVSGGRFVNDASSTVVLSEVDRILKQVMEKEQLREAVRDLLPQFDQVATNVAIMHGEENRIRVTRALMDDTKRRMIAMTQQSAVGSTFEARFVGPVRQALYNHIYYGDRITDAEASIRKLVGGRQLSPTTLAGAPRQRPTLMSQYAGQVARDAVHQYEGQLHREIATLHELHNWRYVGNILPGTLTANGRRRGGTRPQCVRWVKKGIILASELRDEVRWAINNGSGLIPGTTPTTFAIYRGGYNCRHKAIPTRRTNA